MSTPVTLITGASAGIGAALATMFAEHGHAVVLTARREAQLSAVADAIERAGRPRPRIIATDLARPEATAEIESELRAAGLEVQYLVNNAGFGFVGNATEMNGAERLAMVDLNVRALTELSLTFAPSLVRHKGGLLNVASVAGFMPGPGMAVYHATKAYVVSFSEALHQELKSQGVRVTALCPGPVETEFQTRAGMPEGYFPKIMTRSPDRVAREGYDGLMRGRRIVIPGFNNQVAALLPRFVPRGLLLSMMGRRSRNA
ncbi:SDR family NAD(P)-dependent oxidoreductase [Rhodoplanes sp. Z2-YC6860]|uniref:SDR family NAD(P)-dependent oxidoreductase n=1 Tax=Rhodoplanes sp. Z2-YC6860 TaxID=674703 RepID=UPI00078DD33B|nr:SDR family oxidoreductase [Rhodoplanes sp. Z2-YC6860]AMN45405.1 short-chain dehydrogenase/reductase SDR [Rhodoplanes sp. Z2-YC6860]